MARPTQYYIEQFSKVTQRWYEHSHYRCRVSATRMLLHQQTCFPSSQFRIQTR